MDAVTTTHERSSELAALRRRAYGPDADIQSDPDALRRLYELEDLARPRAQAEVSSSEDSESAGVEGAASIASAASVDEPDPAAAVTEASKGARRWWRNGTLWAVSAVCLVIGLVIGAASLAASTRPWAAGPDMTLKPVDDYADREQAWIDSLRYWGIEADSVVQYEAYDTIDVLAGSTADGSRCVLLSFRGQLFTASCAEGNLDPVLDFSADQGWPVPLAEPLGVGGVIRFVARSTGVDVWVRPAAPTPTGVGEQ